MANMLPTHCPTCEAPYGVRRRCYFCTQASRRTGEVRACVCGKEFYVQPNQALHGEGKFCSYDCKHKAVRGVEKVKGTRYVRPADGYVVIKTGIRRWELEHRVVMERVLGRKLATDEQVHHINGVKADNDPTNLQVMSNAEHQRLHDHFNKHK